MLIEIMLTCSQSLLIFLRCTFFFASSSLSLLLSSHFLRWRLSSWFLICIFIFACFNNCWCMINYNDQMIWCYCCVYYLNAVMIHTCHVLIKHARKCEYYFEEKHDCMMNSASRHLQLSMHHAAWMMIHHLNAHIKIHLTLYLQ